MSSLKDYNGIVQSSANSCGAFALAAALAQLGLAPWSKDNGPADGQPTEYAEDIYEVTGNLVIDGNKATYGYTAPVSGTNSPSKMVYQAGVAGIPQKRLWVKYNNAADVTFQGITVANADAHGRSLLEYETNLIVPDLAYEVGPVDYTPPHAGELHIVLVDNNRHWILITKELLYDPASGYLGDYSSDGTDDDPLNFAYTDKDDTITYLFSGLWIQLS